MSEDNRMELSRRKILASAGAVGAAGVGAGYGTGALFRDLESFVNNSVVAGELDLKVSWDEHYFRDDAGTQFGELVDGTAPDGTVGFPSASSDPMFAVDGGSVGDFMAATRRERFPEGGLGDADPCEALADVPGDLEAPVIDLNDVKPGDFGEVTFDFSICDNPGYVWMTGELVSANENGVNDPEAASEAEDDEETDGASLWPLAAAAGIPKLTGKDGSGAELDDGQDADIPNDSTGDTGLWSTLGRGAAAAGVGAAGLSAMTGSASAQTGFSVTSLADDGSLGAADLAEALIGSGSGINITSASYTGADEAGGLFSGGGSVYGVDEGVILSSGRADNIKESADGPDNNSDGISADFDEEGDADLLEIADDATVDSTNDAAVLEFDFEVPEGENQVFFRFIFGSDEYNEFAPGGANSEFNDVFGFFINPDDTPTGGGNVATIDGDQIAIDTINQVTNSDLFNNNDPSDTGTPFNTEADGFSDVLQIEADVNPGEVNTFKLAIADANDHILDSWVLIEGESLSTDPEPDPGGGTVELLDAVQARAWYDDGDNVHEEGEQIFLEGSLRNVLEALSTGRGVPLDGDESTATDFDETGDPPDAASRDCYSAADDVHYIGFEWWVPRETGNQIQSDSVTFDLGFYTEQCRNNTGAEPDPT